MPRRLGWVLLTALVALVWPLSATAQPREGRLDRGYGNGGVARTPFGTAGFEIDVEVTAEGGSAIVADGLEGNAVRLSPGGSWDRQFAQGGQLSVPPASPLGGIEGLEFYPASMTVDRRGRVLVFGRAIESSRVDQGAEGVAVSPTRAAVLRYRPDGELDPTFGGGKGYAVGSFGLAPEALTGFPRVSALVGRVDAAGRPVFLVGSAGSVGGCYGHATVGPIPRAVVRLTAAGLPDPSFGGGDGVSKIAGAGGGESPGLGLDGEDRPLVGTSRVGSYAAECGEGSNLYRLRRDGKPMTSFGPHGMRVFKRMHLAVVEPSGDALLSERFGATLDVSRIGPDGSREKSFGRDGVARVRLPSPAGLHVRPAAVDARHRILLAGYVDSAQTGGKGSKAKPSSFVVGRLLPDGKLDRSFGRRGWIFTRLPQPLEVDYATATLDSKGRLLVAGIVTKPGKGNGGFAVARYLVGR